MTKFSGSSSSSNDAIIAEQRRQIAEQERKDTEKQNRLSSGRDRIRAMFSELGGSFTTPDEWGTLTREKEVAVPGNRSRQPMQWPGGDERGSGGIGGFYGSGLMDQAMTGIAPSYKTVTEKYEDWVPGEEVSVGGIGQGFYDDYKNSIMDFGTPEVERQYGEAKSQNLFDLARRGLLRSSEAVSRSEDLIREKSEADARLVADAENQTAALRGDVSNAQSRALNLLQATEDPTTAANQGQTELTAIQSQQPNFDNLGNLFASALNAGANYQNAQQARKYYESIPSRNPHQGSGKTYA